MLIDIAFHASPTTTDGDLDDESSCPPSCSAPSFCCCPRTMPGEEERMSTDMFWSGWQDPVRVLLMGVLSYAFLIVLLRATR